MNREIFINRIKDGAMRAQQQCGICASLTMAQAILESGWGSSAPGNNLFGIKWTPGCGYRSQVLRTKEYINGSWENVNASFRSYNSLSDSIYDHGCFLVNNSRYKNLIGIKDYRAACKLIQQDGYATDPSYSNTLIKIIQENKLYQYDSVSTNVSSEGFIPNGSIKQLQGLIGATADGIPGPQTLRCCPTLQMGSSGDIVKWFQYVIRTSADGNFGCGTKATLIKYQKSKGLNADGICGANTWKKILGL